MARACSPVVFRVDVIWRKPVPKNVVSRVLTLLSLSALIVSCGGSEAETATAPVWEHTSTTDGNVTTLANIAGSQWGADARLVEELSIGQLEGPDEYAFGMISAIWPTDDRVYVADARLDVARAYDLDGNYLFTIGATGQGPGEYESAAGVIGLPDGRIAVHDGQKLIIYGADDGCMGVELLDGMEALFPSGLRKVVLHGAGHFVHREKPEEVNRILLETLAGD